MRWAARYTFCDPLWRGRARLIVDPELEAVLRHALVERRGADAPWRELLDALVPRERGVPVWMLVGTDDTARLLAPHWPGFASWRWMRSRTAWPVRHGRLRW
ncbi:MAG: hypothetical protein IPK74_21460 [Deltaproteobacteria bacterium]|nr:hypothetical protein [Deltaproteobacteria bacterium]